MRKARCYALLALAFLACGRGQGAGEDSLSQVLVIGSTHSPQAFLLDEAYTPAFVRAALDKYDPTVVGIERNPLHFANGIGSSNAYGGRYVAAGWAAENDVPLYGVDWQDVEALESFANRGLERSRTWVPGEGESLQERQESAQNLAARIERRLESVDGDPDGAHRNELFSWYNSDGYGTAAWGAFWEAERDTLGTTAVDTSRFPLLRRIDARDEHITQHILALLRRYPGGRLAVVIGYGHKPNLDRKLRAYENVRVVALTDLGPITPQDLRVAWRPIDAIAGLRENLDGVLYYFNPQGVRTDRVARLLGELEAHGELTDEVRYLEARWQVIEGRYDDAAEILQGLVTAGRDSRFSYDLTVDWNLSVLQMARLELGRIHDLKGERDDAVAYYQALLEELEAVAPPIPPEDAYRGSGDWATYGWKSFLAVFSSQSIREVLGMLLREPYVLSEGG